MGRAVAQARSPTPLRTLDWSDLQALLARVRDSADRGGAIGTVRSNGDEWLSLLRTRQLAPLRARHPGLQIEHLTSHRPISVGPCA